MQKSRGARMTTDELEKLLEKWVTRLGLSDWDVTVKFSDGPDIDQNQGRTRIYYNTQKATIQIMRPEDRQSSDPNDSDIALDLLHELIHIRLWAIDPKDPDNNTHILREQAIDWIARALLSADRQEVRV